jgi:hypothetical protein
MELSFLKAAAGAIEKSQIRAEAERGDLPVAGAVRDRLEDDRGQQEPAQDRVGDAADRASRLDARNLIEFGVLR